MKIANFNFKDRSITSTGCWPEWTPIGDNCYLAVVTSPLLRNSARSACKRWDWDGDVDLASLWYYSHWNDVKLLLVSLALSFVRSNGSQQKEDKQFVVFLQE